MRNWNQYIAGQLGTAGAPIDVDVVEELAQHATAAYQSARAEGFEPEQADHRVEALVAGWVAESSKLRRRRHEGGETPPAPPATSSAFAGLAQDIRYAVRVARHRPGPPLIAILTMALGISAATVLFSIVWGVLLKPLPWPEPSTLIRLEETREGATRRIERVFTNGSFLAWRDQPATIEALAAYQARMVTMTGTSAPQRIRIASGTSSLFDVLRAAPERGSLFAAEDEDAGNVTVLSHELWRRAFGGDEAVIGKAVQFNGKSYTVKGVLPQGFAFPDRETQAWVPLKIRPPLTPDGGSWVQMLRAIARLRPGFSPSQAADEATARARSGPAPGMAVMAVFGSKGEPVITAEPALDAVTAEVKGPLWVLLAAVALLLATATANVASVQLARAAVRRREMAVRAALGAGGGRLAQQMLVESLVIGVAGAVAGLALAVMIQQLLPSVLPPDFPRVDDIAIDARAAFVAVVLGLLTSVFFGLAPALQVRRVDLRDGLVEDAAASGSRLGRSRTSRVRAAIMAGQVAVACVLLVGASLITRTFVAMMNVDRGFEVTNLLAAEIATPSGLFTPERRAALATRTLERVKALPQVEAAGMTTILPLSGSESTMALTLPPPPGASDPIQIQASYRLVSPGYFETMRIRTVEGRTFDTRDTLTSAPSFIVNRAFAERYPQLGVVGRRLRTQFFEGVPDWEVIGIVDNVAMTGNPSDPPQPEMFVSYTQSPPGLESDAVIAIRSTSDLDALIPTLRQIVASEEPAAMLDSVATMEERLAGSLARPRLFAVVLNGFAGFALAIAGVGLFGVLSYAVSQRSKELGVRAALGASPSSIVRLVLRDGLTITVVGTAVGLYAALGATRWLSTYLFGVAPHDAVTFIAVPAVLVLMTAAACFVPARRAAKVDPLSVLRAN